MAAVDTNKRILRDTVKFIYKVDRERWSSRTTC